MTHLHKIFPLQKVLVALSKVNSLSSLAVNLVRKGKVHQLGDKGLTLSNN